MRRVLSLISLLTCLLAGCFDGTTGQASTSTTATAPVGYRGPFTWGLGNVVPTGGEPRIPEDAAGLARLDAFMVDFQEQRMKKCGAEERFLGGYRPGDDRGNGLVNALVTCFHEYETFDEFAMNKTERIQWFYRLLNESRQEADRAIRALQRYSSTSDSVEAEVQAILQYKTMQYVQGIERDRRNGERQMTGRDGPVILRDQVLHKTLLDGVADFASSYPWHGQPCPPDERLQERVKSRLDSAIQHSQRLAAAEWNTTNDIMYQLYNASVQNGWRSGLLWLDTMLSLRLAFWESFGETDRIPTLEEGKVLVANKKAARWSMVEQVILRDDVSSVENANPRIDDWVTSSAGPSILRTVMVAEELTWPFADPCADPR